MNIFFVMLLAIISCVALVLTLIGYSDIGSYTKWNDIKIITTVLMILIFGLSSTIITEWLYRSSNADSKVIDWCEYPIGTKNNEDGTKNQIVCIGNDMFCITGDNWYPSNARYRRTRLETTVNHISGIRDNYRDEIYYNGHCVYIAGNRR